MKCGPLCGFIIYVVLDCTAVVFASTSAAGSGIALSVSSCPELLSPVSSVALTPSFPIEAAY